MQAVRTYKAVQALRPWAPQASTGHAHWLRGSVLYRPYGHGTPAGIALSVRSRVCMCACVCVCVCV